MVEQVLEQDATQEIALLHQKIDRLTEMMESERQKRVARDELVRDMLPIVNDMTKLAINELDEVGNDFELEDILYLVKRLLRDVRLLTDMLDRVESLVELTDDLKFITTPAFNNIVELLHHMEQKGYFRFANGLNYIADQIVTEFDEEDVRALGDNVVTILTTVRNMTQPEVMAMANNAVQSMEAPVDENISTWKLIQEMRNPETRKGLARLINVVKGLATEPDSSESNQN